MFYEVEVVSRSLFRLSFAFDEGKTWQVDFSDCGVYAHDYQGAGRAEPVAGGNTAPPRASP
jgi:hypothetical protein